MPMGVAIKVIKEVNIPNDDGRAFIASPGETVYMSNGFNGLWLTSPNKGVKVASIDEAKTFLDGAQLFRACIQLGILS